MSVLFLLALPGCATGFRPGPAKGAIGVIGHRGASAYAPENTLASFEKAIDLGADWFELDCALTRDGQLIVIHDDKLDRTTNGQGKVADKTLAELKKLDAGSWFSNAFAGEPLPTLEEALERAKGQIGVYIEIKDTGTARATAAALLQAAAGTSNMTHKLRTQWKQLIASSSANNLALTRKVIAAIHARHMEDQVVVQSFCPDVCFTLRNEAPKLRTELLGAYDPEKPERKQQFLQLVRLIEPAGCNLAGDGVTAEDLQELRHLKKTVAIWTVDEPEQMRTLAEWGATAIISNRPDLCRETLEGIGRR